MIVSVLNESWKNIWSYHLIVINCILIFVVAYVHIVLQKII